MKKEIKEIFKKYGMRHFDDEYCLEFETYIIELKELKILYDYITNLQEENEIVHKDFGELSERYFFAKSRIDKAIEYINKLSNEPNVFGHYGIDDNCKKWLLNILQGKDTKESEVK